MTTPFLAVTHYSFPFNCFIQVIINKVDATIFIQLNINSSIIAVNGSVNEYTKVNTASITHKSMNATSPLLIFIVIYFIRNGSVLADI